MKHLSRQTKPYLIILLFTQKFNTYCSLTLETSFVWIEYHRKSSSIITSWHHTAHCNLDYKLFKILCKQINTQEWWPCKLFVQNLCCQVPESPSHFHLPLLKSKMGQTSEERVQHCDWGSFFWASPILRAVKGDFKMNAFNLVNLRIISKDKEYTNLIKRGKPYHACKAQCRVQLAVCESREL